MTQKLRWESNINEVLIWKGYHSEEISCLIKETWQKRGRLLILCPPHWKEIRPFLPQLPQCNVKLLGDWGREEDQFFNSLGRDHHSEVCFGLFSSGTTKKRKLILYTRENFITSLNGILSFFEEDRIKHIFCYPQPYHIFGLSLGYLLSFYKSRKLITPSGPYSKESHLDWLQMSADTKKESLVLGTPTHFKDLLNVLGENRSEVHSSYSCIVGGAGVEISLWENLKKRLLIEQPSIGYGCSEASPGVLHLPPGEKPIVDFSLGYPLPNIKVFYENQCLRVEGKNICHCIIDAKGIFYPDGDYTIPDIVKVSEKGCFSFSSRKDLILNRGGEKFSLENIEILINDKFKVQVIAMALPDERLGEELGFLVMGNESNLKDLFKEIYKLLDGVYKRQFNPLNYLLVNHFPVNANEKIDREMCEKIFHYNG